MYFNNMGSIYRITTFLAVLATLFSWFVLHHKDATVFFAVLGFVSAVIGMFNNSIQSNFNDSYRWIDDRISDIQNQVHVLFEKTDSCRKK